MTLPALPTSPGPEFALPYEQEPAILTNAFGDGYEQQSLDGLNAQEAAKITVVWNLLTTSEKDVLENFLTTYGGGAGRFTYLLPGESQSKTFTCDEWSVTLTAFGVWSVSAKLVRDFGVV